MKLLRFIVLFATILFFKLNAQIVIKNKMTECHSRLDARHVAIILPQGFSNSKTTLEAINSEKDASITAAEIYKSIDTVINDFNYRSKVNSYGIFLKTLLTKDSLTINNFKAILVSFTDNTGYKYWMLLYGNEFLTMKVEGLLPLKKENILSEKIKKSLLTTVELLPGVFNADYRKKKEVGYKAFINEFKSKDTSDFFTKSTDSLPPTSTNVILKTDKTNYNKTDTIKITCSYTFAITAKDKAPKFTDYKEFGAFTIVSGPNLSTSYQIKNGKICYAQSVKYILLPKDTGEYLIPAFDVDFNQKKYTSNKVIIKIDN